MSPQRRRRQRDTSSYAGAARIAAAAGCFLFAIGAAQWERNVDWTDPLTGERSCAEEPSEIGVWSSNRHKRRPNEAANLKRWVARHPGWIDKQYGLACETPLHFAARFGRDDLAELLVAAGADVDAPNEHGERPLHAAAAHGRTNVVRFLLARGADVDAPGEGGRTPLHAAAYGPGESSDVDARLEIVKLLVAAGADVNAAEPDSGLTPLRYATVSAASVPASPRFGEAGPGATREGGAAIVELLRAVGADADRGGPQGPAIVTAAAAGDLEKLQVLLDWGADVDAVGVDSTALGAAAYGGHVDAVRLLLDHGAAVDRRVRGSTLEWDGLPLAMALGVRRPRADDIDMMARRRDAARVLLRRGADANARNLAGETLLHRMAAEGDAASADLLLSFGAHASARKASGFVHLDLAALTRRAKD